jgi:hypothetical protein
MPTAADARPVNPGAANRCAEGSLQDFPKKD